MSTSTVSFTSARRARRTLLVVLLAATVLLAFVLRPLASPLFLAAVLAGIMWPLHLRLSARLRGHRGLSAAVFVLAVVVLLLGPAVAFATFAIAEASKGVAFLSETVRSEGVMGLIAHLPRQLEWLVRQGLDRLPSQGVGELALAFRRQLSAVSGNAAVVVGATLSATGSLLFQTTMMLIAFYVLLLKGDHFVTWLDEILPLKRGQTRELLAEFKKVSFAVILSTVVTAALQASVALAGYFVARVPHPIFFAGITFFAAFIPAVGAGSVCLLAALLLFATGHPYMALGLALWGLLVVSLVDNLVKPLLIKAGMHLNGAVVFFALVGGLGAFGGVGLILGPMVVALFLSLLRIYERDFTPPDSTTAVPDAAT